MPAASGAPVYPHGVVVGRFLLAVADTVEDPDRLSDFVAAVGEISFTPTAVRHVYGGSTPATIIRTPILCKLNNQGFLVDPVGGLGVHLITGVYQVRFAIKDTTIPTMDIEVTEEHTEAAPLDLTLHAPVPVPPGYTVVVSEALTLRAEAAAVRAENAADSVGAVSAEDIEPIVATYLTENPSVVLWSDIQNKPATFPADSHNHDGLYAAIAHSHTQYVETTDPRLADARTPLSHNHTIANVTGLQSALDGKQASGSYVLTSDTRLTNARTPLAHNHAIADTTGLQAALDSKQVSGSYVLTTDARLSDARTPTSHGHAIADVSGLRTELDGIKATPAGTVTGATVTGLAPGASPTVTLGGTPTDRTLAFGIPAGAPGGKGDTGDAGTITSVTASGLAAGASPTVTLGGTASARTMALGIPAGAPGAAGTITSASATALAHGAAPTVTLGGTASARTIALGIPAGAPGSPGTNGTNGEGVLLVPVGGTVPAVTVPTLLVRY